MKKFFKILGITLASLFGVVLIGASIIIWVIFTPEKLTSIVREQAGKYITCQHEIGQVELTFFSTFPQFGLKINGFTLIHPTQGAVSDTVVDMRELIAKVNIGEMLKNNAVVLDAFQLKDVKATIYVDTEGIVNYDVFVTDTLPQEEDTTAFSIPFDAIRLSQVEISNAQINYTDLSSLMWTTLSDLDVQVDLDMRGSDATGVLILNSPDISLKMDSDVYLQNAALNLHLPFQMNVDDMQANLKNAKVTLNEFAIGLCGSAAMQQNGDINLDMDFSTPDWQIKPLLAIVPATFTSALEGINVDGLAKINGKVSGVFNDSLMPLITLNLLLNDGDFKMEGLPYQVDDLQGKIDLHLDLNDNDACFVQLEDVKGKTGKSSIQVSGMLDKLLSDDMIFDLLLNAKLNLPEVKPMLPEDMNISLQGTMQGWAKAKFTMSQLDKMDVAGMTITGDFNLTDLDVTYDSLYVNADKARLKMSIPNKAAEKKDVEFLQANVQFDHLKLKQGADLMANVQKADLKLQTSNVLSDNRYLSAACDFNMDGLEASMDNMAGTLVKPEGTAYVKMDMVDTTALPVLSLAAKMQQLTGFMDTVSANIIRPQIKASMTGTRKDKTQPRLHLDYACTSLVADMGKYMHAETQNLSIVANARQNASEKNILLQWNPRLNIDLQGGKIILADFPETILIPEIKFDYNNKNFVINDSRFVLGRSDFQLKGEIHNIANWLTETGLLTGELDFVSNVTDVNQLMDLTSGMGAADSTQTSETSVPVVDTATVQTEPDPYMVPLGIDIVLHTNIKKAYVGKQIATNVGGNLYVQNGVLTLEEIGFICEAAKMQLSATYKTPRKNHLYVGFMYHMVDVHIEELASLFPEIIEMIPMLSSFKGKAELHLTAETYMDAFYKPKTSTLIGACSLQGKDLVVLDGETFTKISKLLMFNKKTENKIDTIYAEMGIYKDKIDVYPLLVTMDKYQVALGGHHYLNMDVDYHISLLKPLSIGLTIGGNMDDMTFKVGKCQYAADFKQKKENVVETQNQRMRKIIRDSIKQTMTIKADPQ